MTCGVFEPCFAADDFVVEPDVRSCRERELYVAVHIVLRLLLGDLDGRATHSEMARDFLEVRLFGVLELGGAGEPVAGARALLLGMVDTATMVKEVLNSHWLRGSLTAS